MIKPVCKDTMLLSQKSRPATPDDISLALDLMETLNAHRHECVGMACNMIGYPVCIIAIAVNGPAMIMLNPQLVGKENPYTAEEGCLSLSGQRNTTRYQRVKVRWQDQRMKYHESAFTGFTAQVIQHEIDHLSGILI